MDIQLQVSAVGHYALSGCERDIKLLLRTATTTAISSNSTSNSGLGN